MKGKNRYVITLRGKIPKRLLDKIKALGQEVEITVSQMRGTATYVHRKGVFGAKSLLDLYGSGFTQFHDTRLNRWVKITQEVVSVFKRESITLTGKFFQVDTPTFLNLFAKIPGYSLEKRLYKIETAAGLEFISEPATITLQEALSGMEWEDEE